MPLSLSDFRAAVRGAAPFAPGVDYLLTGDGDVCCLPCGYRHRRNIIRAIAGRLSDGWRIDAVCNTYNGEGLDVRVSCDVCGETIQDGEETDETDEA